MKDPKPSTCANIWEPFHPRASELFNSDKRLTWKPGQRKREGQVSKRDVATKRGSSSSRPWIQTSLKFGVGAVTEDKGPGKSSLRHEAARQDAVQAVAKEQELGQEQELEQEQDGEKQRRQLMLEAKAELREEKRVEFMAKLIEGITARIRETIEVEIEIEGRLRAVITSGFMDMLR